MLTAQIAKSSLSSKGNNAKDHVDSVKNDLIFNLRITREVEFIQFVSVYGVRTPTLSQTEYVRRLQNSTKEILKIGRRKKFTFSQKSKTDVPISRCCFVNFCKEQQRNKQETITHAYTAIALVAVAVEVA